MKRRILKLALILAIPVVVFGSTTPSFALPPFLSKAEKFGARDCAFCHASPAGGNTWNARGRWLMSEKKKRKASAVDVEWLANYKPRKGK
jgi:hypothetical protein